METKNWNILFTSIIRRTNLAAWGNWALNPDVEPGAVGILEPTTGAFTRVASLSELNIRKVDTSEEWSIKDSSVRRTQTEVDFKGGYEDPTTQTEVNVGLKVSWEFSQEGSISSNATLVSKQSVDNFGVAIKSRFDELLVMARSVNYATPDGNGIRQGFGVVTHTMEASGGANVASLNKDSTFSLTGSVDGVKIMTGGGTVKGDLRGSYKDTQESKAFESRLWPVKSNEAAKTLTALSYQFASFQGTTIMPTWITPVHSFRVFFDNRHGGTYIGRCKVTCKSAAHGGNWEGKVDCWGGAIQVISNVPLDATDLVILVDFAAGADFSFPIPSPITEWLTGECTVDLSGVWPWGAHAEIKKAETIEIRQLVEEVRGKQG
ncbi:hypothetical protein RB623_23020 [Mesorhizobium sp. LHD-90]|uniref:hypothetical protein n=1 Tax=Mesorhizobium sp. LHD-90 TaxID=3071414 RepID=UPI0027E1AE32|nr:hypothetical protein [Mesorhizobium sp. LHD-90]MDQ6436933.1 hypothetical protein [Mesorhizobium sp. LHD-90]